MWFLYRLFIVTIALSLTIWLQFAIDCLRRTIQRVRVTLGHIFRVFPLEYIRDVGAESKNPMLTNCEIIFEDFQPM